MMESSSAIMAWGNNEDPVVQFMKFVEQLGISWEVNEIIVRPCGSSMAAARSTIDCSR